MLRFRGRSTGSSWSLALIKSPPREARTEKWSSKKEQMTKEAQRNKSRRRKLSQKAAYRNLKPKRKLSRTVRVKLTTENDIVVKRTTPRSKLRSISINTNATRMKSVKMIGSNRRRKANWEERPRKVLWKTSYCATIRSWETTPCRRQKPRTRSRLPKAWPPAAATVCRIRSGTSMFAEPSSCRMSQTSPRNRGAFSISTRQAWCAASASSSNESVLLSPK